MAGNKIHVLLHKSVIRFFWDRSIGKQTIFDAIGEQVGRAKGFFGQKPEGICLCFFTIVHRVLFIRYVFTDVFCQQNPFFRIAHQNEIAMRLHLRQGMAFIVLPFEDVNQKTFKLFISIQVDNALPSRAFRKVKGTSKVRSDKYARKAMLTYVPHLSRL